MARYAQNGDFLARHLADSATIARWAKDYLEVLAPGRVWSTPGRLTALIRRGLGLGSASVLGGGVDGKDRNDHRHHAIDAVVVALTDRPTLKRVTDAAKRADAQGERLIAAFEEPWAGFVADIAARAATLVVSHKPDTGWQGALHNDTAYGQLLQPRANGHNVVVRRPLQALADKAPTEVADSVADPVLGAYRGDIGGGARWRSAQGGACGVHPLRGPHGT
jgi:CRISPR-associated endonuclease Csn1